MKEAVLSLSAVKALRDGEEITSGDLVLVLDGQLYLCEDRSQNAAFHSDDPMAVLRWLQNHGASVKGGTMVKKKRKREEASTEVEETATAVVTPKRGKRSPVVDDNGTPKRGRGRPKKIEAVEEEASAEVEETPRKRGRHYLKTAGKKQKEEPKPKKKSRRIETATLPDDIPVKKTKKSRVKETPAMNGAVAAYLTYKGQRVDILWESPSTIFYENKPYASLSGVVKAAFPKETKAIKHLVANLARTSKWITSDGRKLEEVT